MWKCPLSVARTGWQRRWHLWLPSSSQGWEARPLSPQHLKVCPSTVSVIQATLLQCAWETAHRDEETEVSCCQLFINTLELAACESCRVSLATLCALSCARLVTVLLPFSSANSLLGGPSYTALCRKRLDRLVVFGKDVSWTCGRIKKKKIREFNLYSDTRPESWQGGAALERTEGTRRK